MPEQQTIQRHHRLRNTIITIVVVPICLFTALLVAGFVMSIFDRGELIRQGDYSPLTNPSAANTSPAPADAYSGERKALIEGRDNPSFGAQEPKITIVQFSDFACPFCQASFPALREIGLKHPDTVKVIFRDWPGHANSLNLALGARCAGEQGKFWEMHDKLFQHQSDTFGSQKNDLASLAQQLGIYNEQFQTCFDSQKYLSAVKQNFIDSDTLGVTGTPTWYINGNKIEGQMNISDLEKIIKQF